MSIFIVASNYFDNGVFGVYSTMKRARSAFEDFLASNENIIAFEDLGDYRYQFTMKTGEIFGAEIYWDLLDGEFEEEICEED